jgi:hypothetical protein
MLEIKIDNQASHYLFLAQRGNYVIPREIFQAEGASSFYLRVCQIDL